jgi:hypothetical protein
MTENGNSKSKGKRLEETEKLEAELERSLAVAKVKEAHKQIEETEKLRKRSVTHSICRRIVILISNITSLVGVLGDAKFSVLPLPEELASTIEEFEQTYASITYDFQKSLDMGEEAMTKMFPMKKVRKDNIGHANSDLMNMCYQLQQMAAYCERVLV